MRVWRAAIGGRADAVLARRVLARVTGAVVIGALMAGCGDGEAADQATKRVTGAVTQSTTRSAAEPAPSEACEAPADVERVTDLQRSENIDCRTAAEVATAYDAAVMGGGEFPDSEPVPAAGFSCRASQEGPASEETSTVACTGPEGTVSFAWGV